MYIIKIKVTVPANVFLPLLQLSSIRIIPTKTKLDLIESAVQSNNAASTKSLANHRQSSQSNANLTTVGHYSELMR